VINDARQKAVKKIQLRKDKSLPGPLSPSKSPLPSFPSSIVSNSRSTSPTSFNPRSLSPGSFNPRSLSPGSFPHNYGFTPHNDSKQNRKHSAEKNNQSQLAIDHPLNNDNIDSAAKALEHLTKLGMVMTIMMMMFSYVKFQECCGLSSQKNKCLEDKKKLMMITLGE
jgi:hypothetical protein